jgi:CrcB protein
VTALLVVAGAAIGAPCRYLLGHYLDRGYPLGTLLVNVGGSLALGWLTALSLTSESLALLATGFCGAVTTYSAFAVHTVELGRGAGTAYAAVTVLGSLAACALGFVLGR